MSYMKDPSAVLDWQFDWSAWLSGDTITSSTFAVSPVEAGGVTIDRTGSTQTTATVWLSGGIAGKVYLVTNHITTAGGRTDERTMQLMVRDR